MNRGPESTHVLVIDPNPTTRRLVTRLLESVGLTVSVFETGHELLSALDRADCGCVVSELRLPDQTGLRLLHAVRERRPDIPVILMADNPEIDTAVDAMKRGAFDLFCKPVREMDLLDRVQRALFLAAQMSEQRRRAVSVRERIDRLSPRERQVLELVVNGLANKQIAFELKLSQKTIEGHRARVMRKMQAESLAQLVHSYMIGVPEPAAA